MTNRLMPEYFSLVDKVKENISGKKTYKEILQYFCEHLVKCLDSPLVWIGLKENNGSVSCYAKAGEAAEKLDTVNIRWDDTPAGRGAVGTAIRTGKVQHINLKDLGRYFLPWIRFLRELNVSQILSFPIFNSEEHVIGALNIYATRFGDYDEEGITLLEAAATQIAFLSELEQKRNKLLIEKEKALITLNLLKEAVISTNIFSQIEYMNPAAEMLTGWKLEEAQNMTLYTVFCVEDKQVNQQVSISALWPEKNVPCVIQRVLTNRNGECLIIEETTSPIRDNDNRIIGGVIVFHDATQKFNH